MRKQQQHLDEIDRSNGNNFIREQNLFKRANNKQPIQQQLAKPHQQKYNSEFEVKWNSNECNINIPNSH
jgi:hypothetical protein